MGAILTLARVVPLWAWAIAAILAWGGWQRHNANAAAESLRSKEAAAAVQREAQLQQSLSTTQRRLTAQDKAVQDANQRTVRVAAAAASAADVGERLRAQLDAINARSCTADSAAALGGQAASGAADMRAYVQRRLDDAAERLARYADDAHIAGQACERAYDALNQ